MIHTPVTAQTNRDPEQTLLAVPPGAITTIGNHIVQMVIVDVVPTWEDALGGPL